MLEVSSQVHTVETPKSHKTINKLWTEAIWRRNSKDLFNC